MRPAYAWTLLGVFLGPFSHALTGFSRPCPLLAKATQSEIDEARQIVDDAIAEMARLNEARHNHPSRNQYRFKPGTSLGKRDAEDEPPPPLLRVTDKIAKAAALIAEYDAARTSTAPQILPRAGTFWMENVPHLGTMPWGNDPGYKVFRNVVKDWGADPTGRADSSDAIEKAMMSGKRCGEKCNGSTTKNAIVYFPPGTYLVSRTIQIPFGTQVIGDANNRPTIKAASRFTGRVGVLETSPYVEKGGDGPDGAPLQWYINTARFFSQIRNIIVDVRDTNETVRLACTHYQAAQAATIEHVDLVAKTGTKQEGMFAENGSGGSMSDVTFIGGNYGLYGGNQQFSATRMTFRGCKTAIRIIWDWGWVWKSLRIQDVEVGMELQGENGPGGIGSITIIDSVLTNIKKASIIMKRLSSATRTSTTGLILDNVKLDTAITDPGGRVIIAPKYYQSLVVGPVYQNNTRGWLAGESLPYVREETLLADGPSEGLEVIPYLERERNQYRDKDASHFVHLKNAGAKGDGITDDTAAVQKLLDAYGDGSKIIYVDSGTYILKDTVTIPKDAKIIGEAWAQFVAQGPQFGDITAPRPMLRVGNEGD
ncbi:hypothetical protein OQA88_9150 [Cercophora sp. LCS_1]